MPPTCCLISELACYFARKAGVGQYESGSDSGPSLQGQGGDLTPPTPPPPCLPAASKPLHMPRHCRADAFGEDDWLVLLRKSVRAAMQAKKQVLVSWLRVAGSAHARATGAAVHTEPGRLGEPSWLEHQPKKERPGALERATLQGLCRPGGCSLPRWQRAALGGPLHPHTLGTCRPLLSLTLAGRVLWPPAGGVGPGRKSGPRGVLGGGRTRGGGGARLAAPAGRGRGGLGQAAAGAAVPPGIPPRPGRLAVIPKRLLAFLLWLSACLCIAIATSLLEAALAMVQLAVV